MEYNVKERLDDHEVRIKDLEVSDASMGEKIAGLTKSIEDLVWWLRTLVVAMITTGIGFIIWFIQQKG